MFAAAAVVVLLAAFSVADAQCTDHTNCLACYAESASCTWCVGMVRVAPTEGEASHHDVRIGTCVETAGAAPAVVCESVVFGSLADAYVYDGEDFDTSFVLKPYSEELHDDLHYSAQCEAWPIPAYAATADTCTACLSQEDEPRWCQTSLTFGTDVTPGGGVCINQATLDEAASGNPDLCKTEDLMWPDNALTVTVNAELIEASCPTTTPPTTKPTTRDPLETTTTIPPTTEPTTKDPLETTTTNTEGGADRAIVMVGPLAFAGVAAVLAF